MRWTVHVAGNGEENTYWILLGKFEEMKPLLTPRL
jgi:hypothetical protein